MPDADVVYHRIGRDFAGAYKELCEGHFSDEYIAASVAKGLRKRLKGYGNQPITLISQTFDGISGAVRIGSLIDFNEESQLIDDASRQLMGHRRGTPLAIEVCKEYALEVIAGAATDAALKDVIESYVSRVLLADFWEHMPLVNHHNNVDPEVIEERLERLRPYLNAEIEIMASQIVKAGNVDGIRKLPRSRDSQPPDFENMDVSSQSNWQEAGHASN